MSADGYISLEELAAWSKPPPQVEFDSNDGIIWIRAAYPYPIEASRIKSARDVIAWVLHLSGKTWATRDLIGEFIDVVARIKDINTRITK